MATELESVSVKSLAIRVLREIAARGEGQEVCPNPADQVGQEAGQDINVQDARRDGRSACGSPHCAGCYEADAETGAKIHPPKCGEDYRAWLEHWEAKGRQQ